MAVANTQLLLEGRNDELIDDAARADGRRRPSDERFEEAAQLRDAHAHGADAARPPAEGGDGASSATATSSALKVGPSGGAIQVFAMRGGRVVERVELATDPGGARRRRRRRAPGGAAAVLRDARAAGRDRPAGGDRGREAMEAWLSARAGRRVRILVPQRGDKRALVELATRNAELSYRTRFNENTAAHFDALETLRAVLGLPALPRRIECFDISTIQGSETVASMVVCEDGRMKQVRVPEVPDQGSESQDSRAQDLRAQVPGRLRGDARGGAAPLSQGARRRRAVSRI